MRILRPTVTTLFVASSLGWGVAMAPVAFADTCDPAATVCQGDVQQNISSPVASPSVMADDQYPFDEDWYFNPAGGGTVLQPVHPGGGSAPSGGGHH
jgi:hypothetical protein